MVIPTILEKEQKFLGKVIFFFGSEAESMDFFRDKFTKMLDLLDASPVKTEFKIWIYRNYFLSAVRFLLTIHTLTATSLAALDSLMARYLKKWCGLPNCVTLEVIHSHCALNISKISDLYMLCHSTELANVRMVADQSVNTAVDVALLREASNKKLSLRTETSAQSVFSTAVTSLSSPSPSVKIIKAKVKAILSSAIQVRSTEKLESLVLQGGLLGQMVHLGATPEWSAQLTNMRSGSLKFMMNASINTLPTMDNLLRWGKTKSDKCKLCPARDSTYHMLNTCSVGLLQGRFKWRHDNVLAFLFSLFKNCPGKTVTADLPEGNMYGGSTISPNLLVTSKTPDLVIEEEEAVTIVELTIPFEPNLEARHRDKSLKYESFTTAITTKKCTVLCVEIGSRGLVCPRNKITLKKLYNLSNKKISSKDIIFTCSSLSAVSSQFLFTQRKCAVWNPDTPVIRPAPTKHTQ